MAMAAPRIEPTATRYVLTRSLWVTKKTMNTEIAVDGVCSVMEITVTATAATSIRRVIISRPGCGDNSRRSQCSQPTADVGTRLSAKAFIRLARGWGRLNYRDGRCAHAEQIRVGVFDFDPHWKP